MTTVCNDVGHKVHFSKDMFESDKLEKASKGINVLIELEQSSSRDAEMSLMTVCNPILITLYRPKMEFEFSS